MKKWILKAIVQKIISVLPYRHGINHLFQQYVTRGVRLSDAYLEDKLIHFHKHRGFYLECGKTLSGTEVLELGTGWYPVIPLCFFLCGAEKITTVDISPLLTAEKLRITLKQLSLAASEGRLQKFFNPDPLRLKTVLSVSENTDWNLKDMLDAFQIRYLVTDARKLPLDSESLDLIVSNNTFEHIYPAILAEILIEFKRLLRPGGMMSHFIDMSDHFAHLDTDITIYNFLRFSEKKWGWIDNRIQPQNRWRISHYRRLYAELGIPVSKEENRPGDLALLRSVPIHKDFKELPEGEVAVSHSYMVSLSH